MPLPSPMPVRPGRVPDDGPGVGGVSTRALRPVSLREGLPVTGPILEVDGLVKYFPVKIPAVQRVLIREPPVVHAVEDVSFSLSRGEIFGVVGESGCGKTTLGRTILRLVEPSDGRIVFDGVDITHMKESDLRPIRRSMQIIFQDPHAALNPAMTIGESIADPLLIHELGTEEEAKARALEIMTEVGLSPAEQLYTKYPADVSGGQKQRAVIARAMILRPKLIVADEPVAMLDMSIRAKILELMLELKEKYGLTYIFITHDLATAKFICDRIAIMYLGRIVEVGESSEIYREPKHPYTQALLGAIPVPDPDRPRVKTLPKGEVPDAIHPPAGCRFHPRCPVATPTCGWEPGDFLDLLDQRALDDAVRVRDEEALGSRDRFTIHGDTSGIPALAPGLSPREKRSLLTLTALGSLAVGSLNALVGVGTFAAGILVILAFDAVARWDSIRTGLVDRKTHGDTLRIRALDPGMSPRETRSLLALSLLGALVVGTLQAAMGVGTFAAGVLVILAFDAIAQRDSVRTGLVKRETSRVRTYVEGLLRAAPQALAGAVRRVTISGSEVLVEFVPSEDPGLRTVDGREVRCVLY